MKKKILVIIIILLLVIASVLFYLYQFTDLLKNDKQMFWTYVTKNSEITELFNNEQIESVKQKKVTNSYKQKSELKIKKGEDLYKVVADTNAKNSNDIFTTVKFEKDNTSIADLSLVKKSNLVGLKMDELANGYITLKNNNLKELAQNMGIENVDAIPESINTATYLDVLELSDEDISYITEKYAGVVIDSTGKSNYKKSDTAEIKINDEIHTAETYKIILTEEETKQILEKLLVELSNDSRTLNIISSKLKLLNFPSEYTSINYISSQFLDISKSINSVKATDDEFVEVTVYVENSKLLQTDIKYRDENLIKIVYDKENNTLNIKQDLLHQSNKFILSISDALDYTIGQIREINIKTDVSEDNSEITTNVYVTCDNKLDITYTSTTKITDNINMSNDYEDSLKIILNNLNEAQLKNLYSAITENTKQLVEEKINLVKNGEDINPEIEEEANTEDN